MTYLVGFLWLKVSHGIPLGTIMLLAWDVVSYGGSTEVRRATSKLAPWLLAGPGSFSFGICHRLPR